MVLDDNESVFLIPMGNNKYAQFRFKPANLIKELLDEYSIPYKENNKRFTGKKLIESQQQKTTLYKVKKGDGKKYIFLFTSNIIDKILDYYKVKYEKGGSLDGERSMS